jgi:hypothetical protein
VYSEASWTSKPYWYFLCSLRHISLLFVNMHPSSYMHAILLHAVIPFCYHITAFDTHLANDNCDIQIPYFWETKFNFAAKCIHDGVPFITIHLFLLIMAHLVWGRRLPYLSSIYTLSVNGAIFLPTRVQETHWLIYSKIPCDDVPSSTRIREQWWLSLLTASSASFQQGDCLEKLH